MPLTHQAVANPRSLAIALGAMLVLSAYHNGFAQAPTVGKKVALLVGVTVIAWALRIILTRRHTFAPMPRRRDALAGSAQIPRKKNRSSTDIRPASCRASGSMSHRAARMEDARELSSWGVKQKPMTSRSPFTATVGEEHILGVTVQPMVRRDGYELIVGSSLDAQFGPVLLFGSGGQLVEVYKDRSLALPPLSASPGAILHLTSPASTFRHNDPALPAVHPRSTARLILHPAAHKITAHATHSLPGLPAWWWVCS